ncbi:MAG: hypothetical protein HQ518_07880, partial [Rhodopirellula sp.]|nr:hypothetical protein [Rhodopirellula sp.]
MSKWFYPFYMRRSRELMGKVRSFDAVSKELVNHINQSCPARGTRETMVLPVSVGQDTVAALPALAPLSFEGKLRRVGFCGASRSSQEQWNTLLRLLEELPWAF